MKKLCIIYTVIEPDDLAMEISTMFAKIKHFADDESGATAIEYGLIAALVSIAAIAALTQLGNQLVNIFNTVSGALATGAAAGAAGG